MGIKVNLHCENNIPLQSPWKQQLIFKTNHQAGPCYLALVLLVSHPEFDIRVTKAVGVHGLEVAAFDQTDADYASPQLSFSVHVGQTHTLILQQAHTEIHR